MGVGGCGWLSLCKISRIILHSLTLRKRVPNSASVAEVAMISG